MVKAKTIEKNQMILKAISENFSNIDESVTTLTKKWVKTQIANVKNEREDITIEHTGIKGSEENTKDNYMHINLKT